MECPKCKRKFPTSLVNKATVRERLVKMCPLCFADCMHYLYNTEWNPAGRRARRMFTTAKAFYPEWKRSTVKPLKTAECSFSFAIF